MKLLRFPLFVASIACNFKYAQGVEARSYSSSELAPVSSLDLTSASTRRGRDPPTTAQEKKVANDLFKLVNPYREIRNRKPLKKSGRGQNWARSEALDIMILKKTSVQPPFDFGCHGPHSILSARGTSAQSIFSSFTSDHSKTILGDFSYTGIGIAIDGAAIYVVQVFCAAKFVPKVGIKRNTALENSIRQNVIQQQTKIRSEVGLQKFGTTEALDKLAEKAALRAARSGNFDQNFNFDKVCQGSTGRRGAVSVHSADETVSTTAKKIMQEWKRDASTKSKAFTISSLRLVFRNDNTVFAVQLFCERKFDIQRSEEEAFRRNIKRQIDNYRNRNELENFKISNLIQDSAQTWAETLLEQLPLPADKQYPKDKDYNKYCNRVGNKAFHEIVVFPTSFRGRVLKDEDIRQVVGYQKNNYVGIGIANKDGAETVVVLNFCTQVPWLR
uniref:SCP domain-containing protein n=1 Tax=Corethron hystrix TaxID=216773 RepID=A0A7S1FZM8_9STRA|mmetsp:Transcript_5738/g.12115  ORF Transcript_5738/g.12115 Transcript_5738/m.12115 type:complete len:444 (+) Transcript_5738:248-1579(+)